MIYKVQQKIFSFADNFTIKNQYDEDCFIVRGKIFTLGNKLKIEDLQGRELVYIEQKLFRFFPEYNIYLEGQHLARVKKEFTFLKPRFNIQSSMGNYKIDGNFISHNFAIYKGEEIVARIDKKFFAFADTYAVDIADTENQPFMLALVIVIDQVLHDNNHNNN